MIIAISAILGAILGGYQAKRRGGNRKDMAQYASAFAILFALLGLFATIILERNLG